MEAIRAAELLIDKIKRDYPDDISFVLLMGSYLYRDTHDKSDVDLCFCAKTKRGEQLSQVFILDGVGYDFWCIPWERLERIANHEERITSLLTEGKLLYYGNEDDLARFQYLRDKALDTGDREKFRCRAREELDRTYRAYFALQHVETLSEARRHAFGVLFPLTYSIALLNRTTVKRGRGKLKGEILAMPLVPEDFATLYDVVFQSREIAEIRCSIERLIRSTERLLEQERKSAAGMQVPARDRVRGLYEEMINFYNKIEHGCAVGDYQTALFAAVELTEEWKEAFCGTDVSIDELPDLIGAFDPTRPERLLAAVREHQAGLLRILDDHGVCIREYPDFEALRQHLDRL